MKLEVQSESPDSSISATPSATINGAKPKQKRNKPTLSCSECVERKTKCDRGRPTCLACIKRQSSCSYSQIADILAAAEPLKSRKLSRSAKNGDVSKCSIASITNPPSPQFGYKAPDFGLAVPNATAGRRTSPIAAPERPAPFNVFGMGSQHPFHNYWTCLGGLPEVVSVLPSKDQADLLVTKYFETVDPLYPIISRADFEENYHLFWSLPIEQKNQFDAAQLALHFVVYATGTQFMDVLGLEERVRTAEFYLSASHQALRISSYLTRLSLPTVQTMVLICYFLISDNHVSDAWTFSGILHQQAYALELNRDPDILFPDMPIQEKQQRCKIWQAILFQDTGLALYLKLPPTTQHYDILPACLRYPNDLQSRIDSEDHTGLSSILKACLPEDMSARNDIAYLRSMWEYASWVQNKVCIPRSLNRPLSKNPEDKADLISDFRSMYRSWPSPFNSFDPGRFSIQDKRVARQLIAVSSSYFFVLMVLYVDENAETGVTCDVHGALDAAHEALSAFFALDRMFPGETDIWWAYHTRAHGQAMMIANILAAQKRPFGAVPADARLASGKVDLEKYLSILLRAKGTADYEAIQRDRAKTLQSIRDSITVV